MYMNPLADHNVQNLHPQTPKTRGGSSKRVSQQVRETKIREINDLDMLRLTDVRLILMRNRETQAQWRGSHRKRSNNCESIPEEKEKKLEVVHMQHLEKRT